MDSAAAGAFSPHQTGGAAQPANHSEVVAAGSLYQQQ